MAGIPPFPSFDIEADKSSAAHRWNKWWGTGKFAHDDYCYALKSNVSKTPKSNVNIIRRADTKEIEFGISSASEIFQETIKSVIQDIEGTKNISDDIICFAKSQHEHDKVLDKVFCRLHGKGLTLNKSKCEFNKTEITFFGVVFGKDGISADPVKVKEIKEMLPPKTVTELKSFLGMTSYCSRFIKNYATITDPLRKLTRKNTDWQWAETEQAAFQALQHELSSDTVMRYYNPSKATEIYTDASPCGVSAIFTQEKWHCRIC
ncbi:uncharacterized protein LOC132741735 [Ruditapes philippinarum]|uniref:uncharacterized protein LOC132741735 n=1 Tax=Ruditapes philippinarum TaxID=129788 RepID=UPI00295BDEA1|nr:uncharacterized protein LOC132741735 [Ruditapes philippinarum]